MKNKVLIIEDEERIRRVIKDYLEGDDITVYEADEGIYGFEILEKEDIDLVILDIMLPGQDGWEICNEIRKNSNVIIVMLTAKSEENDELLGYELGADDYVTKPFSPKVLRAKISALLSRIDKTNHLNDEKIVFINKSIKIDLFSRKAFKFSEEINLTSKEYDLLIYFINNKNIALSREQIICNVWGIDFQGLDRSVDTTIKRLRSKIGNEHLPIEAIRGYGYRFGVGE
ncbi:response regulator transcription factor [Wukongibacter baidiensis]|uniref:response regulator transcription factor n=1 Tax=Wukongibacter baidiensis TaxID=1723361 RepID=UPI003D7FFB8E